MLSFPKIQKKKRCRQKKEPSVMQDGKYCYVTYKRTGIRVDPGDLQKHHVFYGNKDREISDRNGLWCWLRPEYHTASNIAVHCRDGEALDLELKRDCQRLYEEKHSREVFLELIGRNYL